MPHEVPGQRLRDDDIMFDNRLNKRQKTSNGRTSPIAHKSSGSIGIMLSCTTSEHPANRDQTRKEYLANNTRETRRESTQNEAPNLVTSTLTSLLDSPQCHSSSPPMMSQTSCADTPPMTPINDPNDNDMNDNHLENMHSSQHMAPPTPPANAESPILKTATLAHEGRRSTLPPLVTTTSGNSNAIPTPVKTPAPKKEMFLTFCAKDGRPNLRDFIPYSSLKLSLGEFFDLYSKRTDIPLEELEFLTLYYPWAGYPHYQLVWRDGSEVDWRIAEDDVRRLYKKTRLEKPDIQDFEIWVQPGYERSLTPDGDYMDLSRI